MNAKSSRIVDLSNDVMARPHKDEKPDDKKRVIDFDMFLRDLDPDESDEVRGGNGNATPPPSGDPKTP